MLAPTPSAYPKLLAILSLESGIAQLPAWRDALELVLLFVDDPRWFRRAALSWHARYCGEVPDVGFEEAQAVLAFLAGLDSRRPKPAAAALAELVHRRGLERAGDVLAGWAG